MRRYHLHAYNSSGNISGTGVTLGIIGFAINPLLGIIGALLGDGLHNCITKESPRELPFWAHSKKEIRKTNSFYGMTGQELKEWLHGEPGTKVSDYYKESK